VTSSWGIEAMERKYDQKFQVVFKAIRALIDKPNKRIGKIGFLADRNDVAKA